MHRLRVCGRCGQTTKSDRKENTGAHSDPVVAADQKPQLQLSSFSHEEQSRISAPTRARVKPNPSQDCTPSTCLKSITSQLHHHPARTAKKMDCTDGNGHEHSDWIHTNVRWMELYNDLLSYKDLHNGSTCVSIEIAPLGPWVRRQRLRYSEGTLPNVNVSLLDSIGFVWNKANEEKWMEMYDRLIAYKTKYNTTLVPERCKEDPQLAYKKKYNSTQVPQSYKEDLKLARWVHNQRQCCKDKDRVDLLNSIGFRWSSGRASRWMKMYQRLIAYKKEQKTAYVPQSYKEDPQLARWVYNQRRSCKEKGRIKMLDDIGFVWNVRKGH